MFLKLGHNLYKDSSLANDMVIHSMQELVHETCPCCCSCDLEEDKKVWNPFIAEQYGFWERNSAIIRFLTGFFAKKQCNIKTMVCRKCGYLKPF